MKYKKGDVVRLDMEEDSFGKLDALRGVVVKANNLTEYPAYLVMWSSTLQVNPEWVYEDALILVQPLTTITMSRPQRKGYRIGDLIQITFLNYLKDRKGLDTKAQRGVIVDIITKQGKDRKHTVYKILFTDGVVTEYPESIFMEYVELIRGVG